MYFVCSCTTSKCSFPFSVNTVQLWRLLPYYYLTPTIVLVGLSAEFHQSHRLDFHSAWILDGSQPREDLMILMIFWIRTNRRNIVRHWRNIVWWIGLSICSVSFHESNPGRITCVTVISLLFWRNMFFVPLSVVFWGLQPVSLCSIWLLVIQGDRTCVSVPAQRSRSEVRTANARHTHRILLHLSRRCSALLEKITLHNQNTKPNIVQHFNSLPAAPILWKDIKIASSCMLSLLKWIHKSGISLSAGSASLARWPGTN